MYGALDQDARSRHAGLASGGKTPATAPLTAASRSQSAKTMLGDLPPSSKRTRVMLRATDAAIALPIAVDPVNATLSTLGSLTSASPAATPPVTTLKTPGRKSSFLDKLGTPALIPAWFRWFDDEGAASSEGRRRA